MVFREIGDTIPSLIEILNGIPPANTKAIRSEFEPSLKYKYSGGGTTISQLIMQDVMQQPYHQFMRKTIFDPPGMKTSSYQLFFLFGSAPRQQEQCPVKQ